MNKKELKKILQKISTPEENQELAKLDASKVKEIIDFFDKEEKVQEDKYLKLESSFEKILQSFDGYRKASSKHSQYLVETFGSFGKDMVKKLEEVGGTITTSYEKNKPFNAAGVYKDMINGIAAVNKSIKDKPVPVWSWPQYASVGVRNKSFANVNPATDGIGIGDYDYVAATYPTTSSEVYTFRIGGSGATSTIVAIVTVVYSDSTKAQLTSVTKTPIGT